MNPGPHGTLDGWSPVITAARRSLVAAPVWSNQAGADAPNSRRPPPIQFAGGVDIGPGRAESPNGELAFLRCRSEDSNRSRIKTPERQGSIS